MASFIGELLEGLTGGLGELLEPLFNFLVCLAEYLGGVILWALETVLNLLIVAVMALVSGVLGLLPEVELSGLTLPPWLAWVNYLLPVEYFVTLALLLLAVDLAWWVASIALRWAKAVA
jgi:hypothetical protein